jgi:transglutaminase/protease-like cytokinesis protein 3
MKQVLLILILFFNIQIVISQNYEYVDSVVSNYPTKFRSIKSLAYKIDKDFKTDVEKVRAAYYWISNNIIYDYKSFRNGVNGYNSIKIRERDYQKELFALEKKYAEKALKRKMAVCEGYSQLLKFTLQELKIKCEVITGFAKQNISEIGRIRNNTNHAWNAVNVNGVWKLIDVTWSTGNKESNPEIFNFDETYFFIEPEKLILNHFPKNNKWQLLENPIEKLEFFSTPIIYQPFFLSDLEFNKNSLGLIKVKSGDTIKLVFGKANVNKFYFYEFKKDKYSTTFIFEKVNDEYIAEIPFIAKRNSVLTIFNDEESILEYKIVLIK